MVKPGGFFDKLFNNLKEQINYQPKLVGEIYFNTFPAFFNAPGKPKIFNALGSTITIIRQIYPGLTDMGAIFDAAVFTPEGIANALLSVSKKLLLYLGLLNKKISRLEFGSTMIYFLPLNAVLELFLANLAGRHPETPTDIFTYRIKVILEMATEIWAKQQGCAITEEQIWH